MTKQINTGKSNAIWTYLAAAVICVCIYIGVFHKHHYYKFDLITWLYLTIAFCIVIIQMTSFEHHNHWISKLRAFLMVLLIGCPIIYFIDTFQRKYQENQLDQHGAETRAKVIKLFTVKHGRRRSRSSSSYAELEYQMGNKTWKQKVPNNGYYENDTIRIKCSTEQPEIIQVIAGNY